MRTKYPKFQAIEALVDAMHLKTDDITSVTELRDSMRSFVARIRYKNCTSDRQVILKRAFTGSIEFESDIIRLFERNGIDVAKIIALYPEAGLLILEDLGDINLESMDSRENRIQEAIDILIQIHFAGIRCFDELRSIFRAHGRDRKFDLSGYNKQLAMINLNRIQDLFRNKFPNSEKRKILELLLQMLSFTAEKNPNCYQADIPSPLIINDLKPHHFILHDNRFKIIDLETLTLFGIPQIDLVHLLEHPAFQLSSEIKEKYINYYYDKILSARMDFLKGREDFKIGYVYYLLTYKLFISCVSRKKSPNLLNEFSGVPLIDDILQIVKKHEA
ncbi:phosphotransferase [candidate division KSB1 bacterium]|nr:phosphotransferase [candidate division KSB1 bacterium]